jgi:selenocysteine-specific elongation factor
VIVATAGHVDHGKTSLIRQLTGVETDRLAEEQRRGLSISLGYAYLPLAGGIPLGFIDVPGHQRFINNMISGISGIDAGLLVVAADDGPMPQTLEHLDVLELLGIKQLIVAISKIDRVSAERVYEVQQDVEALLTARPWSSADILPVSSLNGSGIGELKNRLIKRATEVIPRQATGYFRLSIDRVFTVRGAGVVVTGTAASGGIHTGETIELIPQGLKLRIRGIRVHDQEADTAMAGQRCALNLSGKLETATINRGDWLVQPGTAPAGNRLDVAFSLLDSAPFALKHLSPVKMYIGAKRIAGRIALIQKEHAENRLQPGASCFAQLILDSRVACFHGERYLLRDHAENCILGGGSILDPDGPSDRKPSHADRNAVLTAMTEDSPRTALAKLVAHQKLVNLDRFRQAWNFRDDENIDLSIPDTLPFSAESGNWLADLAHWNKVEVEMKAHLKEWHKQQPQRPGLQISELELAMNDNTESPLFESVLTSLLHSGDIELTEGHLKLAEFQPEKNAKATAAWNKYQFQLQQCGRNIPLLSQVAERSGIPQGVLEKTAKAAEKTGKLHSLSSQRYALPKQLYTLAEELIDFANRGEELTVASLRSHFGVGRNLTVEILEYFDRIGFTRRQGNRRVVLNPKLPAELLDE